MGVSLGSLSTVKLRSGRRFHLAIAAIDADTVYYSTDTNLRVTEFDRRMYLPRTPPMQKTDELCRHSRLRNLQALSDLYAMECADVGRESRDLELTG